MQKIIIIGAGIIGMLTARLLAKQDVNVTIIDQSYAGQESSWAGGGIISPLYPWRYNEAVTNLAQWGQQNYASLLEQVKDNSGIDPEYQISGLLYRDIEAEIDIAQAWMSKYGYSFQAISNDDIKDIEHSAADNYGSDKISWFTPEIAQVRNPRLVKALYEDIKRLGVEIKQHTKVQSFITKNNKVFGVITDKGNFNADKVVLAGGAWSAQLLESWIQIPKIAPVKGQMIVFKAQPGLVSRIVLSKGRYVIPRLDGRVVLGSTLEYSDFDKSLSKNVLNELEQEAYRIIPALKNYPIEKQWAGLRPGSIDGVPYIGEHPQLENLYLNAGHFRNGVVIGLASCELLVNQLLEQQCIIAPKPYALSEERLVTSCKDIDLRKAI